MQKMTTKRDCKAQEVRPQETATQRMESPFTLRLHPVIRVQRVGGFWVVSVRPTPQGIQTDTSFASSTAASHHATKLKLAHGWRIYPICHDLSRRDAA